MAEDTIESAMKHEADSLEKLLAQRPEYLRLQILRKALRELEAVKPATASKNGVEQPALFATTATKTATSIGQATEFALNDAGIPLTTRELMTAIPRYGKAPQGKNPATNLSNNLSSDERFKSIEWQGNKAWWFSGRDVPRE